MQLHIFDIYHMMAYCLPTVQHDKYDEWANKEFWNPGIQYCINILKRFHALRHWKLTILPYVRNLYWE